MLDLKIGSDDDNDAFQDVVSHRYQANKKQTK